MKPTTTTDEAPLLGDHLALDLLNTEARSDGAVVDYWRSGDAVRAWLARQGIAAAQPAGGQADGQAESQRGEQASGEAGGAALLARALALRTLARRLIAGRKTAEEGSAPLADETDIAALNDYLHAYLGAPHLARGEDGKLALTRTARGDAVASLLGPVAEAVAQLLVEGDFTLVRQCEHPDCILWFYDRTKSHKRRWCSMASCGNRYKAAQFRKKNSAA
ncbi:UNVERIFIED_ORG: putative RNA-binding Zn ribbon-like protein [Zoogloea ramigera]|uniref:CGNR zinc finger domain-containing protein n=1 Tax=Duganella zoogloeoides TaxID=75659 RepID=A0ABZ0XTL9_9BURK|nr:ABATE domain-containing protein [Duganella zoogloeoides]WQH02576.1 CGNR zinc finger domain-containing protein [Duganella zoogloeoides]